jgi:hypothetical protein
MTKAERELSEYKSLYTDKRYAEKAFKSIINDSLQASAGPLPIMYDKNGNELPQSTLDRQAYQNVKQRLLAQGLEREPQQAEMMIENAILRSRFDNSTFNTMLERTMGKVKDEIVVSANEYETMTDEELELLAKHREEQERLLANGVPTEGA